MLLLLLLFKNNKITFWLLLPKVIAFELLKRKIIITRKEIH